MMEDTKDWYTEEILSLVASSLERNGFEAKQIPDRQEALRWLLSTIPIDASVGIGGSVTLRDIGVVEALYRRGNIVYEHWKTGLSSEERRQIMRKQLTSDFFLASSNAVTLDGRLVNIDSSGNRVASMIFGPN